MFIWLLHVIVRVVASCIMSHPLSTIVDVRSIGVSRPVAVVALVVALVVVPVFALLTIVAVLMLISLIWTLTATILILIATILVGGSAVRTRSACRRSYLVLIPGSLPLIPAIRLSFLPILLSKRR